MSDFLTAFIAGLIALAAFQVLVPIVIRLADGLIASIFWRLPSRLVIGLAGWRNVNSHALNRKRASIAAFVLAFCVYLLWPLDDLPAHVGLAVTAAVALLFLLAGLHGARNSPRDEFGAVAALAIAGGCGFLWQGEWYLPPEYGDAARYGNPLLQGFYIAALSAALVWAWISVRPFGGAYRIINKYMRQRAAPLRPAGPRPGFWAEMRDSFAAGRARTKRS